MADSRNEPKTKMSARNTTEPHRVSKNASGIVNALTDYCQFQLGVMIVARIDENGSLMIKADDYADWLLARCAAREQFGFDPENIVREL